MNIEIWKYFLRHFQWSYIASPTSRI